MEWLFMQDQGLAEISLNQVILGMLLAFVCGQTLAWTYIFTHSGLSYSRTYVNSLVIIPFLVATVMMVLSNNIVTAFSLMALFAIVRFRNILRDTLDTCYILGCITLGMACGTGRHGTALVGLVLLCAILFYLSLTSFGSRQRFDVILNLHWARPLNDLPQLQQLLTRHSFTTTCASKRTYEDGNGADLSYRLLLRDPERMGLLIDEVKSFNGASRVSALSAQDESEL